MIGKMRGWFRGRSAESGGERRTGCVPSGGSSEPTLGTEGSVDPARRRLVLGGAGAESAGAETDTTGPSKGGFDYAALAVAAAAAGLVLVPKEAQASGCPVNDSAANATAVDQLTRAVSMAGTLTTILGTTDKVSEALGQAGNATDGLPGVSGIGYLSRIGGTALNAVTAVGGFSSDSAVGAATAAGQQAVGAVLQRMVPQELLSLATGSSTLLTGAQATFQNLDVFPTTGTLANPVLAATFVADNFTIGQVRAGEDGVATQARIQRTRERTRVNATNSASAALGHSLFHSHAAATAAQRAQKLTTLSTATTQRGQIAALTMVAIAQIEEIAALRSLLAAELNLAASLALEGMAATGQAVSATGGVALPGMAPLGVGSTP